MGTFSNTLPSGPLPAATLSQLTQVNSTTYIDLVGVMLGLARKTGETSDQFALRLQDAARSDRSGTYVGILNELRLRLGIEFQAAIPVSAATPFALTCSIAGIQLVNSTATYGVPLLEVDPDNVWVWRLLSQVAADIDALPGFTASLAVADAPALTLARQSNTLLATGEAIAGSVVLLENAGLVQGSELFSTQVPAYHYGVDGQTLYFDQIVPAGVAITYQYRLTPYSLITCPVAILSLTDPNLATVSVTAGNQLAYQAREFIQAVANVDCSYWAL
jgi:hypothetical protein